MQEELFCGIKPKHPEFKALGFESTFRQPGVVLTPVCYVATAGGRPGQHGCIRLAVVLAWASSSLLVIGHAR